MENKQVIQSEDEEVQVGRVDPNTLPPAVLLDVKRICEGQQGSEWFQSVDINEVFARLREGNLELWLGTRNDELEMVCFCYWEHHAHVSHYHVYQLLGINLDKYLFKGLTILEQYTAAMGGVDLVVYGRKGWEKLLEPAGFKQEYIEVRKRVQRVH